MKLLSWKTLWNKENLIERNKLDDFHFMLIERNFLDGNENS